jgi:hypothetical protein
MTDTDIPVLQCWGCGGDGRDGRCFKCRGTGKVFWLNGRAYPYTPEGEKWALKDNG